MQKHWVVREVHSRKKNQKVSPDEVPNTKDKADIGYSLEVDLEFFSKLFSLIKKMSFSPFFDYMEETRRKKIPVRKLICDHASIENKFWHYRRSKLFSNFQNWKGHKYIEWWVSQKNHRCYLFNLEIHRKVQQQIFCF